MPHDTPWALADHSFSQDDEALFDDLAGVPSSSAARAPGARVVLGCSVDAASPAVIDEEFWLRVDELVRERRATLHNIPEKVRQAQEQRLLQSLQQTEGFHPPPQRV